MPVSRTKTFTGCWTCRGRKIKCDLTRPVCKRCEKAKIECAGYSIKLRWSSSKNDKDDDDFFQRRNVDFVEYPPDMMYETYDEMDSTLAKLHSPSLKDNETKSLGPFGVFDGLKRRGEYRPTRRKRSKVGAAGLAKDRDTNVGSGASTNGNTPRSGSVSRHGSSGIGAPGTSSVLAQLTALPENFTSQSTTELDELLFGDEEPGSTVAQNLEPHHNNNNNNNNNNNAGSTSLDNGFGLFESNYQELRDELSTLLASDSNVNPFTELFENAPLPADIGLPDTGITTTNPGNSTTTTTNSATTTLALPSAADLNSLTATTGNGVVVGGDGAATTTTTVEDQNLNLNKASTTSTAPSSTLFKVVDCGFVKYPLSIDNKFGLPTHSLYFSAEARYLLHHYAEHVTKKMTVMVQDKNPWKSIYLPRAITAIGDLTSTGTTPSARNALLHALLAVSAYHLQAKFPDQSEAKEHYSALGMQLKSEAYRWLSECLTKDLEHQRYKDVVTAVLSMVTIDVMSGIMTDCKVHLSACKSIVNMRCRTRPKVSNKAAALHRISGFLGVLQSSTALDPGTVDSDNKIFNDQWLSVRLEDFDDHSPVSDDGPSSSLSYMNEESEFKEYWHKYQREDAHALSEEFYKKELPTTHSLYGIPDSLMLLFSRVCKIAHQAVYYNTHNLVFPKDLAKDCSDVEAALIQWQSRYDINNKQNLFTGKYRQAVNHHTFAFHQSLIIYYFRAVRNLNPEILNTNVSSVLDHLEKIQQLNKPTPICIPLMFPGFMAACATTARQRDLRRRFQSWLDQLTVEGLGTYISARRVITEVWRRRDSGEEFCDWWRVLTDWNLNLMLS